MSIYGKATYCLPRTLHARQNVVGMVGDKKGCMWQAWRGGVAGRAGGWGVGMSCLAPVWAGEGVRAVHKPEEPAAPRSFLPVHLTQPHCHVVTLGSVCVCRCVVPLNPHYRYRETVQQGGGKAKTAGSVGCVVTNCLGPVRHSSSPRRAWWKLSSLHHVSPSHVKQGGERESSCSLKFFFLCSGAKSKVERSWHKAQGTVVVVQAKNEEEKEQEVHERRDMPLFHFMLPCVTKACMHKEQRRVLGRRRRERKE